MSQALTPPNSTSLSAVGLDLVIRQVQSRLTELDWLENSLGRVVPQIQDSGKYEPWIYKANGEYYKAYPNDTLTSFSCLYAHDDERYTENGYAKLRTLSVIVSVNLKRLQIEPPTVEGLKRDVHSLLMGLECVSSVNKSFDQTAVGATGIYPGFDVATLQAKYLTYPYGAFRIETTVHWFDDLC